MSLQGAVPLPVVFAYSGAGKTTFLNPSHPPDQGRGDQLDVLKHARHSLYVDLPGKDS